MDSAGNEKSLTKELTDYYRDSLWAGKLTRCDFSDDRYRLTSYEGTGERGSGDCDEGVGQTVPYYQVERVAVASGRLPEDLARMLFEREGSQDEEKRKKRKSQGRGVEIEVAWHTLRVADCDDGARGLCDAILSLPALVGPDGAIRLAAKGMRAPLMPRALLDEGSGAQGRESALLLGKYERYRMAADRASQRADAIEDELDAEKRWERYLDIAQECFDEVVDIAALDESLMEVGLSLDVNSEFVQICPARVSATRQIERLYQNIVRSKGQRRLSLYNDLLSVEPRERKVAEFPSKDLAHVMKHCGAMDRTYCLSPSQRRAMWCFLDGDERSTLAVSGPPGTGKTTLLKAMVADMLVRRALEGSDADAPVIVGTSTNNQAVLNIIDTFGSVGRDDDGLFRRWLPDPHSIDGDDVEERAMGGIGCFLPSAVRRQWAIDAGYYVSGSYGMDGVFADCLEQPYCECAVASYNDFVSACLHDASAHDLLVRVDRLRRGLVEAVSTEDAQRIGSALAGLNSLIVMLGGSPLESSECPSVDVLDKALDTKVRPLEFWLAVHQFERRWLDEAEGIRADRERIKGENARADIPKERYFSALANLTPLLCMTMFRVPSEFSVWSRRFGSGHMFAGIDLLIVDEAGQVSTPVGAASFALARRAVAMGDVEQIPPVWSFEPDEDERRMRALFELGEDEAGAPVTWGRLQDSGLTASEASSVMSAAQHRCQYQTLLRDGEGFLGGVLLTEHYRCQNPIIEVCNDLSYHGLLEPRCMREVPTGLGLEPLELIEVRGTCVPRLTSRVNREEAERVVGWLARNFRRLRETYPEVDESEIVGVITPFKQQAVLIGELLRKGDLTRRIADKVIVGTAHALQGAERRVVLFSLVYDVESQTGFVDGSPNLLNVAVSRAQDSFLVVGDSRVLRKAGSDTSLGVLARHLGLAESGPSRRLEGDVDDRLTITLVLRRAREDADRSADERNRLRAYNAQTANLLLHEHGYLDGAAGDWTVSEKGRGIGMSQVPRRDASGETFEAIVFNEKAAEIVVDMLLSSCGGDR